MRLAIALCALLMAMPPDPLSAETGDAPPRSTIDPSTFKLTFADEFDTLEVGRRRYPGKRWTSGLPYNGDFGKAYFLPNPRRKAPFLIENGVLIIEAKRTWSGRWESGLLSSVDGTYKGFFQKFGYFEARIKMPSGAGTWPAFWLLGEGQGLDPFTAEIDIVEFYPGREKNFDTATHVWRAEESYEEKHHGDSFTFSVEKLSEKFNTYGALITPTDTIFYLNREEINRYPTFPEHHQPMFILLNLALENNADLDALPSPQRMYVDYVRVYDLPAAHLHDTEEPPAP